MRTMQLEKAHRAAAITEGHEILAHDAQAPRQVAQLVGQNDRLPDPSQIVAGGRARPNSCEFLVVRRTLAMVVCAIGCAEKWCSLCHRIPSFASRSPRFYQRGVRSSNAQRRPTCHSAGKVAGEREGRIPTNLATVDLQVFEDALNVVSRLVDRDHLDPVHHVDVATTGIAVIAKRWIISGVPASIALFATAIARSMRPLVSARLASIANFAGALALSAK